MIDERLLMDLADRIRGRFYGKYRGTVAEVDEKTMRLKANVPAVLGDQPTGWAMPCVPYAGERVGIAFLPEISAGVWIEFEGGDVSYPIWTGCYWRDGEIPEKAKADAKVIVTRGTTIVFHDGEGSATWTDGNDNAVTLDSNGVALEHGGKNVKISGSAVSVNDGNLEVQ